MTFLKIGQNDLETFSITTNPNRTYASSSTGGATGSVYVFPRRSSIEKELTPVSAFLDATKSDNDLNVALRDLQSVAKISRLASASISSSFYNAANAYMSLVDNQSISPRKQKFVDINRVTPTVEFTQNTVKKLLIKDMLMKHYRTLYPTAQWAYTNYNCLNFFTASTVPTSSALLYPNLADGRTHTGYAVGQYIPSGAFSFDFYINPRYKQDQRNSSFKAGTILHMSSCFALSLVTGSLKDENGKAAAFRLQLQLSHSADVLPSLATQSATGVNSLTFLSSDNSLLHNDWHHVVVRWGTNLINNGTGSFVINGIERGTFVIPSSTIAPRTFTTKSDPSVLVVGNFYEGTNSGSSSQSYFFAANPAERDGLEELDSTPSVEEPALYSFNHPLNAEIHDLSIKRKYMSDLDIQVSSSVGPSFIDDELVAFYLPPFFVQDSPFRSFVGTYGGIPQTPFFEIDGTTDDPFNVAMSFGVAGHYVNLENFVRDFGSNVFPRLHHLTMSVVATTSATRTANEFIYDQPRAIKRNLTILPCDDGNFSPSFDLLLSESRQTNYVDDLGIPLPGMISLANMVSTASALFGTTFDATYKSTTEANSFVNELIGYSPEQPGLSPGKAVLSFRSYINSLVDSGTFDPGVQDLAPLTVYQRTLDNSSNQITIFDISKLFYGDKIKPGSITLTDSNLSGSSSRIQITLKDDGFGNMFRSDSNTKASTWNSVGNVFYDEGLILIKSPHLNFFGKEAYTLEFKGERNVHVLRVDVLAGANMLNSSSNPTYQSLPPTQYATDVDERFVYVTNINLHDENMNVVAKANLAQPFMKRDGNKVMFKIRVDY